MTHEDDHLADVNELMGIETGERLLCLCNCAECTDDDDLCICKECQSPLCEHE